MLLITDDRYRLACGSHFRYRYAGHSFDPLPLPAVLATAMASASRVAGTTFNAVNVNVYDDDNSALARHRYVSNSCSSI